MSDVTNTVAFNIPTYVPDFSDYFDGSDFKIAGAGHYADVYSAMLGKKKFALKVLRRFSYSSETDLAKNFNFELMSWLEVGSHRNVLGLVGICYTSLTGPELQPGFLSEWQDNREVMRYLESPDAEILDIIEGILQGLEHMHKKGVVHGDLRSGNILVSSQGVPKISDFGLSKLSGRESSSSGGKGTLRWMARELLEADSEASGPKASMSRSTASDVWSVGMTILELYSGEHPFHDYKSEAFVVQVIVRGELPKFPGFLHEHWWKYEPFFKSLCEPCWVRDPQERPGVKELLMKLRRYKLPDDVYIDEGHSLTPRARPRCDADSLSGGIDDLSLSGHTKDLNLSASSVQELSEHELRQQTAGIGSQQGEVSVALSEEGSPTSRVNGMSYMTALNNHIATSKKVRELRLRCSSCGPDHAPTWKVDIMIDDGLMIGSAHGPSKKIAQEEAAKQAYGALERETITPAVRYLPIFINRLEVHGLYSQFRWHTEVYGNWAEGQSGGWISTLYRNGVVVGRGRGCSPKLAEGEAARIASLSF